MKNLPLTVALLLVSTGVFAQSTWIGNFALQIDRAAYVPCEGGMREFDGSIIEFGEWPRSRAAVTYLCFEVYQQGVTEYYRNDIAQFLKVMVNPRINGEAVVSANYVKHVGNNAVYALDLRTFDPYDWKKNPDYTVDHGPITANLFFWINETAAQTPVIQVVYSRN